MKPRVAVFSVFSVLDGAYSISTVALDQLRMLERHGYAPQFWLSEGYRVEVERSMSPLLTEHPGIDCRFVMPVLEMKDYQDPTERVGDDFEYQVRRVFEVLDNLLEDVDVVLTHDVMFQTSFLAHACAVRKAAARHPNVRWLHWVHSAPSARPEKIIYPHTARYSPMPNAKWVFLNRWHAPSLAAMLGVDEDDVTVIPNTRDVLDMFDIPAAVKAFARDHGLLDADALMVYPACMRSFKQQEAAVKLAAGLSYSKLRTKLVFANSYSNDAESEALMEKCREVADVCGNDAGFSRADLVFTSEEPGWRLFCPPDALRWLQWLADIFFLPSRSEACSLVALEAAATRTLLVLNDDFPPMREWFGSSAFYLHCGSDIASTAHSGQGMTPEEAEMWYYRSSAIKIAHELRTNKVLDAFRQAKARYSSDSVFRTYLEPLLIG